MSDSSHSHSEGGALASRPVTNPRKNASQARSRATVDALVEATARILVRDGFERASTNRIAAAAGVSVGSLYQYFPGKEALVAAVIERHNRDLMQVVQAAIAQIAGASVEVMVRTLVAAAVEAHRLDPALHRVLAEQTPRAGDGTEVLFFHREAQGLFRAYLEDRRDELGTFDLDLAAFVCVTSIEALTHSAVIHRPAMLTDDVAVETLVGEATRLINGYLRASSASAAPGSAP